MHKILKDVQWLIAQCMAEYLPEVRDSDLEKNGAVFYMNAQNGTAFDWFVNGRLPPFMVFYNDEGNMDAAKLYLYADGRVEAYLYGDKGASLAGRVENLRLEDSPEDILALAVLLRAGADDRDRWDGDIRDIPTDTLPGKAQIRAFLAEAQG